MIVGAGTAGTSAALRAVESGLDVIMIEKTQRISGTGACATGPLGVASSLHVKAGRSKTPQEFFTDMMEEASYKINAPLVSRWINASGKMIDWLQAYWTKSGDPGFGLPISNNDADYSCQFGKGTKKFQDLYDKFIIPGGVKLFQSVQVNQIDADGGRATGVTATNLVTGGTMKVKSRVVLVCTGGFGGNPTMLKQMFGRSDFYLNGLASNTGDGINMCEALGCTLSDEVEPHLAEFGGNDAVDFYAGYMKFVNQLGFLALDPDGNRFMNEELFITGALESGASALRRVGYCYIVFTDDDFKKMTAHGVHQHLKKAYTDAIAMRPRILVDSFYTLPDEMSEAIDKGQAFKADTLDGLATAFGFDAGSFKTTMNDYSAAISSHSDPVYGKNPDLIWPLVQGPFYAIKILSPIDGTYNGVKIDSQFRPLAGTDQKVAVDGLYVVGQDSGGVFSYPYTVYVGATSSYALTSGMLSIDCIKEYLGK